MRSLARESVFKYIFSQLFNQNDEGLFTVLCKELDDDDKSFADKLLLCVENNKEKYSEIIDNLSHRFKSNRILKADRCILTLGMAELDNFPNTPVAVIINEAVNLAAKYSTENSTDYVNGMLSGYVKERENG